MKVFKFIFFLFLFFVGKTNQGPDAYDFLVLLLTFEAISGLAKAIFISFPIKELILVFYCIQMLSCALLDYYYFADLGISHMNVDSFTYFSFSIPCYLALWFSLQKNSKSKISIKTIFNRIANSEVDYFKFGILLIVAGYIFQFLFSQLGIRSLVFTLLEMLKFVGALYVWLSGAKHGFKILLVVFVPVIIHAFINALLIDALAWTVFLSSFYFNKYKVNKFIVYFAGVSGLLFLIVFQSVKGAYREVVWFGKKSDDSKIELIFNLAKDYVSNVNSETYLIALYPINHRLNQGTILSAALKKDKRSNHQNLDRLGLELLGIALPRFLFPSKPEVGDHQKFKDATGWGLASSVAMNLSIFGDGLYLLGKKFALLFVFFYGLIINFVINKLIYNLPENYHGVICWAPLILFFIIRPGNEFYNIFNWLFKSSIFVFIIYYFSVKYYGKKM